MVLPSNSFAPKVKVLANAGARQTVAAVIATYNRRRDLETCLDALLRQTHPLGAIYIIDNASTDDTGAMIAERELDAIRYIRLKENTGSAGGFRAGMELAFQDGFEWFWITDNDSIPCEDSLERLLDVAQARPEVMALAPKKLRESDRQVLKGDCLWDQEARTVRTPTDKEYEDLELIGVDWSPNTGLLVKRSAVLKVGHLRADLFAFGEDVDYCLRLRPHSKIFVVTNSVVLHPEMGTGWPVPFASLRKLYYLKRNEVYLSLRGLQRPTFSILETISRWMRMSVNIVRKQDHRWRRLQVVTLAMWHGAIGRLGPAPSNLGTQRIAK